MPENPPPTVEDRLAALAARLEETSPPLTAADVLTRRMQGAPTRRHPLLAAGGAALAVAAAVAGFVLITGDDEPAQVETADRPAGPATTTPTPAGPEPGALPFTMDGTETPALLVWDNSEMALIDYSGKELARAPMGGWYTNQPDLGVNLIGESGAVKPFEAVPVDDTIPGCGPAHGRGGVLAVTCPESGGNATSEIRIGEAGGTTRRLTGPRSEVGHWRYALPSPDGKWVLGQWSAECELPIAFLIEVATGRVDDVAQAGTESYAIGWAPDGRAIVGIGAGPCSNEVSTGTGTFLVDPAEKVRTRIHPFASGTTVHWEARALFNRLERRVDRAITELGLEACCGEPSHGSESSRAGMMFEGAEITIFAVPPSLADDLDPVQPHELRFRCGDDTYTLIPYVSGHELDPQGERTRLQRAADLLASRLYCATGS